MTFQADVESSATPDVDAVKEEKELLLDEEDFNEYRVGYSTSVCFTLKYSSFFT